MTVLYVPDVAEAHRPGADVAAAGRVGEGQTVAAWRPAVAGVREVFHARFISHVYPPHTHDSWTLLIVDTGAVRFGLDRHEHGTLRSQVTLLPPDVPHDGRSARPGGFRKRVLYLDRDLLGDELIGTAVDTPTLADPTLRRRIGRLHDLLLTPGEDLAAQSGLTLVGERLRAHLGRRSRFPARRDGAPPPRRDPTVAHALRDLLDSRIAEGITLAAAAELLGAHPTHLIRAFHQEFGLPPHRYLTGRRVDLARRLLLAGHRPAEVATLAGFYDQAHLTRHFRRMLATSPARYARPT
ncbi:transcriptional regulator, AraC family [Frankia sp. CpI1-P]|uniref:AraC family transcriptional regulator n=1 Tax=unclassified Frankia TaxID=2632575 RepID=UPI0006F51EDC|nr:MULTISPECIES: AraC family transcriptional regulator [unclassified Frankia]KQM02593.1 transcriptional regulator, AraC family [Frankia sp. CpI1-P]